MCVIFKTKNEKKKFKKPKKRKFLGPNFLASRLLSRVDLPLKSN